MTLHVNTGWLLAAMLLSLRVAAATAVAPVLGPAQIPGSARVVLAFGLAVAMLAALPVVPVQITSAAQLGIAALAEAVMGLGLSLGFLAAYAAAQVAGSILDIQIGFGVASVIDPGTRGFAPLLGTLLGMALIAVFLGLDGHHMLIRALVASVHSMPPGTTAYTGDWAAVLGQSGVMFTFGAALAGPVMISLLLADVALALMARSMPQMNVFLLSFAIKVTLGFIGLAITTRLAGPLLTALFENTWAYWDHVTEAH